MSPNLAVKSESWIDLSREATNCDHLQRNIRLIRGTADERQVRSSISCQREQDSSFKTEALKFNNSRPSSLQVNRSSLISNQNKSQPQNPRNEHLLIRLRQQSYLNRSSNSLASNLSASIELNPSLAGGLSLNLPDRCQVAHNDNEQQVRPKLLKAEPRRLSFIRNKLQRRKATTTNEITKNDTLDTTGVVRSWSSLSERLAGKFSHFRHSWKHLLHSYSSHQDFANYTCATHTATVAASETHLYQPELLIDKQRLTGEWISRHQWQDASSRPKSLDISPAAAARGAHWSQLDDEPIDEHWTRSDLQLEKRASSKQQDQHQQVTCCRPGNSSITGSSATLVSLQPQQQQQQQQQQFTLSPSSNSFDSIASSLSASSRSSGKMQQTRGKMLELPAPLQTSDYWSTAASSDYYKQHLQQQQQQQQQQHQQQQNQQQLTDEILMRNQPVTHLTLLANDQEYYLDVASATALESQHIRPQMNHLETLAQRDDDYDDYAVPSDESYRLERSQVELVQMIGEGQKGYVFLGKLQSRDGSQIIDVAIKTLKYETEQLIEKLMREAAMMRQFEHPHIIKFIGVCPETPALIAMELAQFGEIKTYLESNRQLISVSQLILFTFQISTALSYLESKQYVHRDVAARNVLVCSHSCVKLADFGLSRNLVDQQQSEIGGAESGSSGGHYVCVSRGKLPVRWLAPESLAFRRFTSASDVWMFAVCTWELFQFGQVRPWAQIRNNQVLAAIELGQRLAKPATCPLRLYQLMLQCWSYAPGQRPKFRELKQSLWSIYLNERAQEQLELEQQQQQQQRLLARQQQDRLLLLMNSRLQQIANSPQQQQNISAISSQVNQQQQQQRSPTAHLASYSSTANTATATTDNSSRSSSMGSLVRNKRNSNSNSNAKTADVPATIWQVCQLPVTAVPATTSTRQVSPNAKSPTPSPTVITSNRQQLLQQQQQQQAVDRNMRRFQQRTGRAGQALQKQRSQGSIVNDEPLSAINSNRRHFGLDDHALLGGRRARQQRALLASSSNVSGLRFDDGAEADEDSSEPELSSAFGQSPVGRLALPDLRLTEPAYEGLQNVSSGSGEAAEIAMLRRPQRSPMRDNVMLVRPLSWRQPQSTVPQVVQLQPQAARQKPSPSPETPLKFGQKLERALQSMSATPMKARLARQRSVEPRTLSPQPAKSQQLSASPQTESVEEQRQLALHQRILGHIRRPKSPRKAPPIGSQRDAANEVAVSSRRAETVDQSLELLESLIEDHGNSSGANRLMGDRHAHSRKVPDQSSRKRMM